MLSNGHAGFGGRAGETRREQSRQGAPVRPTNLSEAVERTVAKHRNHLRDLAVPAGATPTPPDTPPNTPPDTALVVSSQARRQAPAQPDSVEPAGPRPRKGRLPDRTRQRHAAVHARIADGKPLRVIASELGLSRNTVRRFARAGDPEELLVNDGTGRRPKALDRFAPYLRKRWDDGCTNAAALLDEIRAMGYRGSPGAIRQYLRPWRSTTPPTPPPEVPPTVRKATGWILRNPDHLDTTERQNLDTLTAACPTLAAVRNHIHDLAVMMLHRRGRDLDRWMAAVHADDLPDLRSFVAGLRRDYDAARAGLTLPHSSGKVEGHVNRIKMIKRQMYGRANPDLLRKRILLAD